MNADHRKTVARLRNFGIVGEDDVVGVGLNGKLSEVHAALGLALIGSIDGELRARRRLAERYRERLTGIEGLRFQRRAPETMPNHSYFTVEISPDRFGLSRDELHVALRAENVITRRYFYPLCSDNECYRHLPSAQPDRLPNARQVAASVLCLPIYGGLDLADVDRIADAIIAVRAAAPQVRQALKDRGS
jgi:dTDP-4-amino-4,6-dideoxygalactose transaminase